MFLFEMDNIGRGLKEKFSTKCISVKSIERKVKY